VMDLIVWYGMVVGKYGTLTISRIKGVAAE
jgi:hypothetical protein